MYQYNGMKQSDTADTSTWKDFLSLDPEYFTWVILLRQWPA